jgi:PAS domain-containing protein
LELDTSLAAGLWEAGFTFSAVESNPAVIYILDRSFRIVYCNPAWNVFAQQNGGQHLLRSDVQWKSSFDGASDLMKEFYRSGYEKALEENKPWEHDYECSSPEQERAFRMRVIPLKGAHLFVENVLRWERPHDREVQPGFDSEYLRQAGFIVMCANCRRTERLTKDGKATWEWIPSYVEKPPSLVSHGLCRTCRFYYYR